MFVLDLHMQYTVGLNLYTNMVQERIFYYVHIGTNVYGLLFDASKAFDQVDYCKLDRGFVQCISRLLLNMYTNQKLKLDL